MTVDVKSRVHGVGEVVAVRATACNRTSDTYRSTVTEGYEVHLKAINSSGRVVAGGPGTDAAYRSNGLRSYTFDWSPGECRSFDRAWDGRGLIAPPNPGSFNYRVPAGYYQLVGSWTRDSYEENPQTTPPDGPKSARFGFHGVVVTTTTDKREYTVGEAVTGTVTACNPLDEATTQRTDTKTFGFIGFTHHESHGDTVMANSGDPSGGHPVTTLRLAPRECHTTTFTWDGSDHRSSAPASPGDYRMNGLWLGSARANLGDRRDDDLEPAPVVTFRIR